MDVLTFISSIIRDLSTPISALIALCILLGKAPALSKLFKSIKFKDIELNLREELEKAKNEALSIQSEETPESGTLQTEPVSEFDKKIIQLANIDPKAAIFELWKQLESSVIKLIQHNGLIRFTRPDKFIRWLGSQGKISDNEVDLFLRLKTIRNQVVHASMDDNPKITMLDVLEFKDLASLFIKRLESIKNEDGYLNYPIPPEPLENMGH
jgi:hypothetical protein